MMFITNKISTVFQIPFKSIENFVGSLALKILLSHTDLESRSRSLRLESECRLYQYLSSYHVCVKLTHANIKVFDTVFVY